MCVWQNGRAALGDVIYRYITSDQFSQDCLLDCLDLSSEYQALEIANRVEASIYVWRRKGGGGARSSWGIVKDMVMDTEKRDLLAERAEALLMSLKQRFPGLTQTSLDMSKIQYNKVQFAIHRDESSFVHRCLGRTSEHFLFFFPLSCSCVVSSGRGQIDPRELLEGPGEPGLQHHRADRRPAQRRRAEQATS